MYIFPKTINIHQWVFNYNNYNDNDDVFECFSNLPIKINNKIIFDKCPIKGKKKNNWVWGKYWVQITNLKNTIQFTWELFWENNLMQNLAYHKHM